MVFDIYTGKNKIKCAINANILNPDSTQTTKVVVGLLQKANLLEQDYHVYIDNYHSSPDLFWELHYKEVLHVGHVDLITEICQKQLQKQN